MARQHHTARVVPYQITSLPVYNVLISEIAHSVQGIVIYKVTQFRIQAIQDYCKNYILVCYLKYGLSRCGDTFFSHSVNVVAV